ncbi:1,4-alpha-glucan branching protein GlgB [Sphingobacterium phlebotomi]|uniref:1,4-alpha-glucan branching enzyme GlgB n=1 Tax=Sphingobacterium phlebotomi TaxID=2605433 RepID=A0A5D4H236_9SPHI|nr:1,4-alpha-glucan branching protein GlgB [Sphingobacterium phlebotomi]TYR34129.1 1,4-alpha-glucan branching protein GlgB [Sphingobacterium phlebotomi]
MGQAVEVYSLFTDFDINLFCEGRHFKLYEKLGSHTVIHNGKEGVHFAVWAPNAASVSVVGNFNGWNPHSHQLHVRWDSSGIWEGFIEGLKLGEVYKYHIHSNTGEHLEKADPFALVNEQPPHTASVVGTTWYQWNDQTWMRQRHTYNALDKPFAVYEMHIGSWLRDPSDPERFLSYREIADKLVPYLKEMGFTHVEFMPVMEHPFYPSWGYQITGYFAASSRYGSPQDLMHLIESLHKNNIGVILDWVPSHFPGDAHGLYKFDGSHLFEHEDPRKGFHPDWKSYIFNYGRNEVRSFLISNAFFWLDRYHIDGLRVDAVASMLYLDYSRNEGEWIPNEYGGRENLEAVHFLKEFNEAVYAHFPDVQTIAEESTSWPGVSKPTFENGLGFGMKWMMGWMHDTLNYFKEDPINRRYHHDKITFGTVYSFHENFMLPLSHDEVVHGKQSLIYKMPGDVWQKFANLRALYLYMYTFVGTKLLFMGGEFGQTSEWNVNQSLDWHLTQFEPHRGMQQFVKDLNLLYRAQPALYERAFSPEGFQWVELGDHENSVFAYLRRGNTPSDDVLVVLNLTPVVRDYCVGVPMDGLWEVILNSDDVSYYGSGIHQHDALSEEIDWMGYANSITLKLPPLGGLILKQV